MPIECHEAVFIGVASSYWSANNPFTIGVVVYVMEKVLISVGMVVKFVI